MTDTAEPAKSTLDERERRIADRKRKRRIELMGAVVIAIAAVLTAWVTFDAGAADSTVEQKNTDGLALTLRSNDLFIQYDAERALERDWIFSWIAAAANEEPATPILTAAMPPEVADLTLEWFADNQQFFDDPEGASLSDPFDERYASYDALPSNDFLFWGREANADAQCAFFEAREAEIRGDGLGLATVFLAIALLVIGIAALLNGKAAQIIVIIVSIVSLIAGAGQAFLAGDPTEVRAKATVAFFSTEAEPIPVDEDGLPQDIQAALALVQDLCPNITPVAAAE